MYKQAIYKESYNETTDSRQYSIRFSDKNDAIVLTMRKIYSNSWTYSSTYLTREKQIYYSGFSYYAPSNSSNTPDFDASYAVYANNFGKDTNIVFDRITGDRTDQEYFEQLAKLMTLDMLNFTDYIYSTYLNNTGCSIADFGFNIKYTANKNQTSNNVVVMPENNQANTNSDNYPITSKITLSSFPLYLYADDGTFLGNINSNKYDSDSIANEYGKYGSKYQTQSIFNQYGNYGSKYSQYSAFNEYATKPPKILDRNGKVVGYLTANKYLKDAISYEEMMVLLKKYNK